MEIDRRVAILEATLSRQLGWIAAADAKTGFIFGIGTAMLGLLASAAPGYGRWTPIGVAFSTIACALLLASLACAVLTVFPRTRGPLLSVVFFGGIAARQIEAFRIAVQSLSEEAYEEDLTQQCHINASIAGKKYQCLKFASFLLASSVIPWLGATYTLFRDR
jgi:hypothetical protein